MRAARPAAGAADAFFQLLRMSSDMSWTVPAEMLSCATFVFSCGLFQLHQLEDETCAAQARMPNCSMWTSVSTATALSVTVTFMVPDESGSLKRINCPARVQDVRRIGRKLL